MARIRSIKPEIRESKVVLTWPFEVRYFWVLLWGYLDDHGRGNDMPKRIAGDCYPEDPISADDVDKWLNLMTIGVGGKPGPVCRYEVDGRRYVHAVNWSEHQKPNRPSKSRIPKCPLHEGGSEPLNAPSVLGAAEQRSRGAEEQQQAAREPLTALPAGAEQAARLVQDAADASPELAVEVVLAIARERKPRNLPGLVRRIIDAGELGEWLTKAQQAIASDAVKTSLAQARASPECEHQTPGGTTLHPVSGKPLCPLCRKGKPP